MSDSPPSLVTGAAGFIGTRLALALRAEGLPVRALVRPAHDASPLEAAGVEIVRGDAADRTTMTAAAAGCDVIYHLAAARGPKKLGRKAYMALNTAMTEAAVLAAHQNGARLVAASTVRVIASAPPGASALGPLSPTSGYYASKAAMEEILRRDWRDRGLDAVIARVAEQVAGPGARDWRRLARAIGGGRLRMLPEGGEIHTADIDDVVSGLRLCAGPRAQAGSVYVLVASLPAPVRAVFETIARELGVPFAPARLPGGPFRAYKRLGDAVFRLLGFELPHHFTAEFYAWPRRFDTADTEGRLGYRPRYSVLEAVARTAAWLRGEGLA